MRLGCGCLALVMGAINVIIIIFMIVSFATTKEEVSTVYLLIVILFCLANAAVCLWAGWTAVRGGVLRLPTPGGEGEEEEGKEEEK